MEVFFADGKERKIMDRDEVLNYFHERVLERDDGMVSIGISVWTNLKYLILRSIDKGIHRFEPKAFYTHMSKLNDNGTISFTDEELISRNGFFANEEYTLKYFDWIMDKLEGKPEETTTQLDLVMDSVDNSIDYQKIANDKIVNWTHDMEELNKNFMNSITSTIENHIKEMVNELSVMIMDKDVSIITSIEKIRKKYTN